jgi:hypothetical protein
VRVKFCSASLVFACFAGIRVVWSGGIRAAQGWSPRPSKAMAICLRIRVGEAVSPGTVCLLREALYVMNLV